MRPPRSICSRLVSQSSRFSTASRRMSSRPGSRRKIRASASGLSDVASRSVLNALSSSSAGARRSAGSCAIALAN